MIIHPLLASVFPILFFYAHNQSQLRLGIIYDPLLISLVVFSLIWLIFTLIFRHPAKSAILTTFIIFIFFSYTPITFKINNLLPFFNTGLVAKPLIFILFIFLAINLFSVKSNLSAVTKFLNFVLLLLVGFQLASILPRQFQSRRQLSAPSVSSSANYPDIYYIILDAYARGDTLQQLYGYDNEPWLQSLEDIGFTINRQARSNYSQTFLSLSSTLNLDYVNYLTDKLGKSSTDTSLPLDLINHNQVCQILKQHGYQIINFASGWGPTDQLTCADVNYDGAGRLFSLAGRQIGFNEFSLVLLQTTVLSPFIQNQMADKARDKVIFTLDKLKEIPYQRGNKFVLAHFNVPHPPYLFDQNGQPPDRLVLDMAGNEFKDRQNYLNQLIFINQRILQTLQAIVQNSASPPIIIVQADHGPASVLGHPYHWPRPADPDGVKERLLILSAYHLPDGQSMDTLTPVNNFRFIFNRYLGTDYAILEEKSYFSDYQNIYEFFDVTSDVESGWR